jgi:hypothetical protein
VVESLNTKVDLTIDATAFTGLTDYGKLMVGDKAFEFYNDRDPKKNVQIPWEEVDVVLASVMFKGKWIPRFAIRTKRNGTWTFSSKRPKDVLRAINVYIPGDRMVHSLGFFDVMRNALVAIVQKVRSLFKK